VCGRKFAYKGSLYHHQSREHNIPYPAGFSAHDQFKEELLPGGTVLDDLIASSSVGETKSECQSENVRGKGKIMTGRHKSMSFQNRLESTAGTSESMKWQYEFMVGQSVSMAGEDSSNNEGVDLTQPYMRDNFHNNEGVDLTLPYMRDNFQFTHAGPVFNHEDVTAVRHISW
jgi:hypothetical protein